MDTTTNKPIVIYTWKDTKLRQTDPKVVIRKMESNILGYDPSENAKQLARLFAISLPGSTLDAFYGSIAHDLMKMIEVYPQADKQHIENIIRIAISKSIEGE